MASRKNLLSAVLSKLRTDATLVTLTGHTASVMRIGRSMPPVAGRSPYLGVTAVSETAVDLSMPFFKRYVVEFQSTGADDTEAMAISDRVEDLLDTSMSTSRAYWDFTTSSIRVDSARFLSRAEPEFNEDYDLWLDVVRAVVIANPYIGCP